VSLGVSCVGGAIPATEPGTTATSFRGAFGGAEGVLWTTDWTALNLGGMLVD